MTCSNDCIKPSPSQAHCGSSCHVTFGSVRAFDTHRRGGACRTPAEIGCSDNGKGVYRWPLSDEERERLAALRRRDADAPSASPVDAQGCETGSGVLGSTPDGLEAAETLSGGSA